MSCSGETRQEMSGTHPNGEDHRGVQQQPVGFTGNKLLEIVLAMGRIPSIGRTMKPKSLVGQSIVFQFEDKGTTIWLFVT